MLFNDRVKCWCISLFMEFIVLEWCCHEVSYAYLSRVNICGVGYIVRYIVSITEIVFEPPIFHSVILRNFAPFVINFFDALSRKISSYRKISPVDIMLLVCVCWRVKDYGPNATSHRRDPKYIISTIWSTISIY